MSLSSNEGGAKMDGKPFQISLRAARVNANLTQDDVAKRMGKTRQTVVNWENGKYIPGIPELEMLSKTYNIPVDYIFLPINSTKS